MTAVATGKILETSGGPQFFKAGTLVESPTASEWNRLESIQKAIHYNTTITTARERW